MMIRETTDHETPLAIERQSAGLRVPLLHSAAGQAYLACCPAPERAALIDALARSNKEDDKPAREQRADLERQLAEIAAQGYATASRTRRLIEELSVAVPVTVHDGVLAVLSVRFMTQALPAKTGLERFLPKLRESAAKITASLLEQQTEARKNAAPEAAV
jgi:IclR family mhp operon transcriptional activator